MRKALLKSILVVAMFAFYFQSYAGVVSLVTAKTTALNFYKVSASHAADAHSLTATLKYTQTAADGTVVFYVFDISPAKGFVIVSASDQVAPVIGYSLTSNFQANVNGKGIQSWMNHATAHIHHAILNNLTASPRINGQWTAYLSGVKPAGAKSLGVAPLLKTTWDQEPYYNQLCPYNNIDHQRALTGCVATAMAQIMKYWAYPIHGTDSYMYLNAPPSYTHNYGSQSANFGNTTYNWAAMPNSIDTINTAVATIMYHAGVAAGMNYGDDNEGGSGSYVLSAEAPNLKHSAQMAYATYFGYNPNTMSGVRRSDYSDADWIALMKTELDAGRPIQYEGTDPNDGGHTWVCDGYDENDMLHMNWGWGGLDNGYFSLSSLTADGSNFSIDEAALIGIQPNSNLAVTASASNNTICRGGSVTLKPQTISVGATYHWTPSTGLSCSTCATTQASPTGNTTYTLIMDSAGLSATSQVSVSLVAGSVNISMINITNATTYGSADGTAQVDVSGGVSPYSYVWNNHATTNPINNLTAGSYSVTISDSRGCSASAAANVTQPDSATSSVAGASHSFGHPADNPVSSNTALSNKGGVIYIQKAAIVTVQGDLLNTKTDSTGTILNDGVIELTGNFQNDSGAVFKTGSNSSSTDRAVKFIGNNQSIIGSMSTTGKASFYNLVIDQVDASDTVLMKTPVAVEGSLVFGSANTTTTYNPTSYYTNHNQKGLLKTFDNLNNEYLLDIQNGNPDAIGGYPVLETSGGQSSGFVLTSGLRGSANGGLQRKIASATSYLFPIGTTDKGFNAMRLNFSQVPGGGSVKAKFCSGSSNPSGHVGSIGQFCPDCPTDAPVPSNTGYNRYFPSNECNSGAPQWVILEHTLENHGYWSLASTNSGYTYDVEVFANSLGQMDPYNAARVIKHEAGYGVDPSLASVDWSHEIDALVSNTNDLLTFTKNIGCYNGAGIPGGTYRDFSHFAIANSSSGSALPVQLLFVKAESEGKHHVSVTWATAVEINNAGFFVMRSSDGVNFADVGWVVGHDNSTVIQNYAFDDRVPQNITYYYKLRQVDNNGKFVYSNIVQVKLSDQAGESDFALYPNPTANDLFLDVKNPMDEVKVEMYDIKGQLVYSNIFTVQQNGADQTLTIHASSELTLGTYILTATTNGVKYSAKAILQ